jgi:hypothetical protein
MKTLVASLAVGLLAASLPALAQESGIPKSATPTAARTAAPTAATKKPGAKQAAPSGNGTRNAELPAALAAIPQSERLAIQSDLVWLGGFEGMSAEEVEGHTVDAIKAFQRRNKGRETGVLSDQERASLADAAKAPQAAVGWRLIDDTATGARLGLPAKLVPKSGVGRTGSRWSSAGDQVQIETFRLHEASLPALFEQEKKTAQRSVGYSVLNPDSFVIAGEQKLKRFLVRAQASGSEVRGITILYDQATEGTMARVAVAVTDTFEGFPDPNAGPLPGTKRGVEYGTAIVVTSQGDLVALGQITDECRSITVPGFGHADRVAEDKSNDLALLRLYGARNLVPAPLDGDGDAGTDLTLFGIADPLAQAGDSAVTSATAQLTAQGIVPAPKPGFSGAPAVDAQGRFAGIVELKSAIVAGLTSGAQQAALVPAAAVRAFLSAQAIAPAAGRAAMDQSVVRVICVRN